jgi:hypothetical protein
VGDLDALRVWYAGHDEVVPIEPGLHPGVTTPVSPGGRVQGCRPASGFSRLAAQPLDRAWARAVVAEPYPTSKAE